MDFAFPAFLWALPAVLAPVLIHLFFKRKRKQVDFSSLMFLTRDKRFFAYRRKLMELLLLFLRCLAILLLVLAMASPFFKHFSFYSGAKTCAVIVFDDTMSMARKTPGGISAFEYAKRQTESLLSALGPGDSAGLIFVSGRPGLPPSSNKNQIPEKLRSLTLSASPGGFSAAFAGAATQLEHAAEANKEIYVVSDFQKTAVPERKIKLSNIANIRLFAFRTDGSSENLSVSGVKLPEMPFIVGKSISIPFTVNNFRKTVATVPVSLEMEGRTVASTVLPVKPGSHASGVFTYVPERTGRIAGRVFVEDPDLPLDNSAPFTFTASGTFSLTTYSAETPDPFYYFRAALDPLPGEKPVHGIRISAGFPESFDLLNSSGASMIALSPDISLTEAGVRALTDFIRKGGTALFLPERGGADRFYRDWKKLAPVDFPTLYSAEKAASARDLKFHSGLSGLNGLFDFSLLEWRALRFPDSKNGTVLASSGEKPMIVLKKYGRGRIAILGFGLRRNASNWPELKSFPAVMLSLVNHIAGNVSASAWLECGESLNTGRADLEYVIDGKKFRAKDGIFPGRDLPGLVFFSETAWDSAAVSAPLRESDPAVAPDPEVRRMFDLPATFLNAESDPAFQIRALRKGTPLAGLLFLLAMFLLAGEFVLGVVSRR